jgi:hypothetical protein
MTAQAIKIIKPVPRMKTALVATVAEVSEIELDRERVVTIEKWISQRRDNGILEIRDTIRRLVELRKTNS